MGHPPAVVWKYTPRQLHAFLFIASKRREREQAEALALNALAAQGTEKAIKKAIKDMAE